MCSKYVLLTYIIKYIVQSKTKAINSELFYEAKAPTSDGYSEM